MTRPNPTCKCSPICLCNPLPDPWSGASTPPTRVDPLVLDLNRDGKVELKNAAFFDLNANGFHEFTRWPDKTDAFLVLRPAPGHGPRRKRSAARAGGAVRGGEGPVEARSDFRVPPPEVGRGGRRGPRQAGHPDGLGLCGVIGGWLPYAPSVGLPQRMPML